MQAYQKFKHRNVEFVGLSIDEEHELEDSKRFLVSAGYHWPNAYGAIQTKNALGVITLPAVFVVTADGRIVWTNALGGSLEQAIEKALQKSG